MILMKDIIREGHETLSQVAEEIKLPMSDEDKETLSSMLEYIKNSIDEEIASKYNLRPSVGLAAPQINIKKRMLAVHTTDERERLYSYMLINPKIVSHSEEMTYLPTGEGCLSIDREIPGYVPRYKRITIEGYQLTEEGEVEKIRLRVSGYVAIVFQHEIDHLNGILFPDRMNKENPYIVPDGVEPLSFD